MLFTFPSRYWFTIGLLRVFSLAGWSRRIHTGFLVSRATQDSATLHIASCTQLSCSTVELSRTFHSRYLMRCRSPTTPVRPEPHRFGLFPVRSPLLGESLTCFLFLEVLRCFSSLGWRQSSIGRAEALGCPIRRSPDQWSFAPTRGLSQLITSFIAWMSQGIRRSPFPTFDNT